MVVLQEVLQARLGARDLLVVAQAVPQAQGGAGGSSGRNHSNARPERHQRQLTVTVVLADKSSDKAFEDE